jgi:flavin-dependent dehydrogenase
MPEEMLAQNTKLDTDAVIIGGGLSGLAAALHLARAGMRVVCIEPRQHMQHIVGESLDWSAPNLLADPGLPIDELVRSESATYKRHIILSRSDGTHQVYRPGSWLARTPWQVEVRTMHLDRQRVQATMETTARSQGVSTLRDRALAFVTQDGRIDSIETSQGRHIRAWWYVDASGSAASLFGRGFNLASISYGPRKVAVWTHVSDDEQVEGTRLYALRDDSEYMEWVWEIPVRPGVNSLGYVAPGGAIKMQRNSGLTTSELFLRQLAKISRFQSLVQRGLPEQPTVTSFQSRPFLGVCGKNWIIIGEAASQSDPITGNGVTAALRHANEASELILRYERGKTIPLLARLAYNMRVVAMGRFFNSLIEKIYYEPSLRARLGLFGAGRAYTIPAWLANLAYSRMRPRRLAGTVAFCFVLAGLRLLGWASYHASRQLSRFERFRSDSTTVRSRRSDALHLSR